MKYKKCNEDIFRRGYGIDLYKVKELMGHSDIVMTERYSHLSPKGLQEAIKVLEK